MHLSGNHELDLKIVRDGSTWSNAWEKMLVNGWTISYLGMPKAIVQAKGEGIDRNRSKCGEESDDEK